MKVYSASLAKMKKGEKFCFKKRSKLENHFMWKWVFSLLLSTFEACFVGKLLKNITPINFLNIFTIFQPSLHSVQQKHRNEPHYLKVIIFRAEIWFYDMKKKKENSIHPSMVLVRTLYSERNYLADYQKAGRASENMKWIQIPFNLWPAMKKCNVSD